MDGLHLKALEIQGFKSFPDKTVLQFDASITAIVGPNGSGKSNISDAIRWVLGEQSTRALRGGKMEDVIFGGTEKRRSHGFAEVSLILDNEDAYLPLEDSEVMVTRRYYRSGDSEYYMNRHLVRLRDIHELFMDTGLGQDGYCLVGQGKIDEILSVKSTQRRDIFEEAAGISRFRHRKEEAERKLEHTKDNLLRIGDKIEELELQIGPLKQQAEKAKRYFRLEEELRLLEISLWMDRLGRLRRQEEKVKEAFEAMRRQLEEAKCESERLYAASERLLKEAQEKEEAIEKLRRQGSLLEEQSAACEQRLSVLEVQIKNHRETMVRLGEEQETERNRGDSLEEELAKKQEALRNLSSEECSLRDLAEQLDLQLREAEEGLYALKEELEKLGKRQTEESQSVFSIQSSLSAIDASSQEIAEREKALLETWNETDERRKAAEVLKSRLLEKEKLLKGQKEELDSSLVWAKDEWSRWDEKQQQAQEDRQSLRMEETTLTARIRVLEEMEKHYEGYSKSVKTVMEEVGAGKLRGVHGPVASLIHVPEPYTIAIEIALGASLQNLVVETELDGKRVLEELRRRDAGRITCLPLHAVRASKLEDRGFLGADGYLGIASELITAPTKFQKIVTHLLGRVVVVRDLDCGISLARQKDYRFRIVTLDGQVLSPGGAMTGGSVNRKGGILTRSSELESLCSKQEKLRKGCLSAEEKLSAAKEATLAASRALQIEEEKARDLEHQLLLVTEQGKAVKAQTEQLAYEQEKLKGELAQLQKKQAQQEHRKAELKENMTQLETSALQLCANQSNQETKLREQTAKREALLEELRGVKTKLAVFEAEGRISSQSILELQKMRETITSDYERRREEMAALEKEIEALLQRCREEEEVKQDLQSQKASFFASLQELNREKLELEAKRTQTDRESRSQSETLLHAQKEAAVLEQKKLSCEQEEAQLLGKLWERYEISHEAARAICIPIEDPVQTERQVSALKGEIRSLGHVNVGAVEEYERIRERYEYLKDQKQDVEEAAAQLLGIIETIVLEMRSIFKREFARIDEAFRETFVTLFQGGKASLELEDEQDVLNCGIEIKVQPPGKSLKNLNLLSGGEKAFVAIALYFAILKIRPTPFCVLDEIEAALDDANVFRFSHYLRSISDKTQFIVITHRRGTMEEADVLYGVTMEQQGTSRILRLNLNEAELAMKGAG